MDERMDAATAVSRTVEIPGLTVNVVEAGEGAPILLLHGFPQSSRVYSRVMPRLAEHAHVVAADMRGAGETEVTARGYDIRTTTQDLIALLDALGWEQPVIVAHDWSAFAAFELGIDHPQRVGRVVVIAAPPPYLRMNAELLGGLVKAMKDLWFQFVVAMPIVGPRLLSGGRQRLARWILRHFEVQPIPDEDVEAYLAVLREPARARAAATLYRRLIIPGFVNIVTGRYRGRVLQVPTLVLFGAEDRLIPRDAMRASPEDAPDLRIEFVPGGAHYLIDDNPHEVARLIAEFAGLARDRSPAPARETGDSARDR